MYLRIALSIAALVAISTVAHAGLNVNQVGIADVWPGSPFTQTTATPDTHSEISNGSGTNALTLTHTTSAGFTLDKFSIVAAGGASDGLLNIYPSPAGGTEDDGFVNLGFSTSLIGGGAGLPFTFNGTATETILEFDLTGADQITLDPNTLYAFDFQPSDPNAGWDFFVRRGDAPFYTGGGNIYSGDLSDPNIGGQRFDLGAGRRDAPLALYAPATGQTVLWESFEDPSYAFGGAGWGWTDFNGGGGVGTLTTVTGVTDGSNALEYVPASVEYDQGATFKLQDLTNDPVRRANAWDGFINNNHIAFDVTWDPNNFFPIDPNNMEGIDNFSEIRLIINYGGTGGGQWSGELAPDIDTGNPDTPGNWDRFNYTELHTRTVMWDYTEFLNDIMDPNSPISIDPVNGYLEFIIVTNAGSNYEFPTTYQFDNFRFTTPSTLLADVNSDGRVDGLDFLIIQSTDPSLIPQWELEYGLAELQGNLSSVPEPSAAMLLLFGVATMAGRRQRRVS